MTPMTTAMPSTVAKPEISISQRTRATIRCCSGLSGFSSASELGSKAVMAAPYPRKEKLVVAAGEADDRLDRVLAARTALSRTRLKALILDGAVMIGPRTIRDPGYRVNAGEVLALAVPTPEPAKPAAENIPLKIVFEDDEIIVIDKLAGLVVHPAP